MRVIRCSKSECLHRTFTSDSLTRTVPLSCIQLRGFMLTHTSKFGSPVSRLGLSFKDIYLSFKDPAHLACASTCACRANEHTHTHSLSHTHSLAHSPTHSFFLSHTHTQTQAEAAIRRLAPRKASPGVKQERPAVHRSSPPAHILKKSSL